MQYFDVKAKMWEPLASTIPSIEACNCYCAASAGNNLYVAGFERNYHIYRYDTENNVWEKLPHPCRVINNLCIVDDYMYAVSSDCTHVPQRYSFSKCQWQTFAEVSIPSDHRFYCNGAAVLNSKLYVLYGRLVKSGGWFANTAKLCCFDPVKNEWKEKGATCETHFGSSIFVVNSRIYVAGGCSSIDVNQFSCPLGDPARVEGYDEENNTWSVVEQKRIPPNNLNAVEIEGKVFFIINKFPVDSGIRIPPRERYPVHLGEWQNLAKIAKTAALCYMPVKRESLKSE